MSAQALVFSQAQLTAIADALGHTQEGLIGSEIGYLLGVCGMKDTDPGLTKRRRIFNALAHDQNVRGNRTGALAFIRHAMKRARFMREPGRFELLRARLNRALLFAGLVVLATGELEKTEQALTVNDAMRRVQELRADLTGCGVHADVLKFCRAELLADDYFHAVLEAVKSVAEKLRIRTGLSDDGATLVDRTLSGNPPILAINSLNTESEHSEQRGFANLVRGHLRYVSQYDGACAPHPLADDEGGCRGLAVAGFAHPPAH